MPRPHRPGRVCEAGAAPTRPPAALARRSLLLLAPAALLGLPCPTPVRAGLAPPRFMQWIGRTAVLRAEASPARLYLRQDGTGVLAARLGLCWSVPVWRWRIEEQGLALSYVRRSAIDPAREITGEAHIDPGGEVIAWRENGRQREAELLALEPGDTTGAC